MTAWTANWPVWVLVTCSFALTLLITLLIDGLGHLRARWATGHQLDPEVRDERYAVLVPIYGNIKYLTNKEALAPFADRIVLCTTTTETDDFYRDLDAASAQFGFRQLRVDVDRGGGDGGASGSRSTSAPIRDQVMDAAIDTVTDDYVVCIDADTVPRDDFAELVGQMSAHHLDVVSVVLTATSTRNLLEVFQAFEYRMGMVLRRVWPWVLSGGCHAARTDCYRAIMGNHSKYFQGNDVEVGILARELGYRTGHVRFTAATDVPARVRDWRRQRWAWAGGEFRLSVVNVAQLSFTFALYMSVFVFALNPVRWWWVVSYPASLLFSYGAYLILIAALWWLHRRELDLGRRAWWLAAFPLYSAFTSLLLVTCSPYSYVKMALEHHNWGVIAVRRPAADASAKPGAPATQSAAPAA